MIIKTNEGIRGGVRFSNNTKKGQYGYNGHLKKVATIKTVLLFAVSFSLLIAGYLQTGTRNNVLTVVAILGCLPASKSAVNMILSFRAKGCSAEDAKLFQPYEESVCLLYDLYITSEKKSFSVGCMAVTKDFIYAYLEDKKADAKAAEAHVKNILRLNKKPGIAVKFLTDREVFLQRLNDIRQAADKGKTGNATENQRNSENAGAQKEDHESHARTDEIADIMKAISL